MQTITMQRETPCLIVKKEIMYDEIATTTYNKKKRTHSTKFESLFKYSYTQRGYARSLLLEGYVEV